MSYHRRRTVSDYQVNQENAIKVLRCSFGVDMRGPPIRALSAVYPPCARLLRNQEFIFGGLFSFIGRAKRFINYDKIWNCLPSLSYSRI
jgi:hypothetical protein